MGNMTQMTTFEARVVIQRFITETLTALAFDLDDDMTEAEITELEASMDDISTVLMDALGLEVLTVENSDDNIFTVRMELLADGLPEGDEEIATEPT